MIRNPSKEEIDKIVNLHLASLKEGALYQLGGNVLKIFYEELLKDNGSFILVYEQNKIIVGVAASTKDVELLLRKIKRKHFLKIAFNILKKSLTSPKLPFKLLQKYPSGIKPELLFLFVDPVQRGKGIGEELVKATSKRLKNMKIKKYKITILSSNFRGKKFYERIGFYKIKTYSSFGEERDVYLYKIK